MIKEGMTRRIVPEWLDRIKSEFKKNKRFCQLKTEVVVIHCNAIMILTLKRFSGCFEDVCRSPDASIRVKTDEVYKQFSRCLKEF